MHRITLHALVALLLATVAFAQEASRPVDTLQFGLLDLGMSMATVRARLGPPAHIEQETRTVLVPIRDRAGRHRHKHDAPPYVVRTTEYEVVLPRDEPTAGDGAGVS